MYMFIILAILDRKITCLVNLTKKINNSQSERNSQKNNSSHHFESL